MRPAGRPAPLRDGRSPAARFKFNELPERLAPGPVSSARCETIKILQAAPFSSIHFAAAAASELVVWPANSPHAWPS